MLLGLVGIFYGAVLAFAQTDLKRLVAYTSISHMGFVVLGVFAWREMALQGAVMQMLCHGLSTGALFVLVGALQERIHTRDLARMGGLWSAAPRMGAMALFFALASLGLPGLGNFVGEFLVLVGSFQASPWIAAVAALGMVAAVIYSLWLIQAAFHGPNKHGWRIPDLSAREMAILLTMAALLLWLGLYPQPVFNTVAPTVKIVSKDARARVNVSSADHMPVAAPAAKPRPPGGISARGRIAP
jgi:NADH-quinone oxidoreductase subunit M